jgi:hypothetical protein
VNLHEDNASKEAVKYAYNNIFRTETGKEICRDMYCID